jgi:hypothetical protein
MDGTGATRRLSEDMSGSYRSHIKRCERLRLLGRALVGMQRMSGCLDAAFLALAQLA